jgi:hypothetical protein
VHRRQLHAPTALRARALPPQTPGRAPPRRRAARAGAAGSASSSTTAIARSRCGADVGAVPTRRRLDDPAKGSRHNRGAAVDVARRQARPRACRCRRATVVRFTERAHPRLRRRKQRSIEARQPRAPRRR